MAKCGSCGKNLGIFSSKRKCLRCGDWLCKDCEYMAEQSRRCPACGRHEPFQVM